MSALPPLPEQHHPYYTAEQMQVYGERCRALPAPLTDEQIVNIGREAVAPWITVSPGSSLYTFARAIERAHGIGAPKGGA